MGWKGGLVGGAYLGGAYAGGVEVFWLGTPKIWQYRQEERGFEPGLWLGLDLTWLVRVRQKVSVVLYSCMAQRSECLALCAGGG